MNEERVEANGCFRDGSLVVVQRFGGRLPAVCYKTGDFADLKAEKKRVRYSPPGYWFLSFLGVIAWKNAEFHVYYGAKARKKRSLRNAIAGATAALGFLLFLIGIMVPAVFPIMLVGIPLVAIALLASTFVDPVKIRKMTDHHVWILGLPSSALSQLTDWEQAEREAKGNVSVPAAERVGKGNVSVTAADPDPSN